MKNVPFKINRQKITCMLGWSLTEWASLSNAAGCKPWAQNQERFGSCPPVHVKELHPDLYLE